LWGGGRGGRALRIRPKKFGLRASLNNEGPERSFWGGTEKKSLAWEKKKNRFKRKRGESRGPGAGDFPRKGKGMPK